MEERIERYSVILIPFPPNPKVQEEIKELVNEHLNNPPEILRTEIFEGLCFRWRTWYGFDDWTKEMSLRRFKSGLERIYERSGEEMLIIDWRDEDDWEYVDLEDRKQYAEVFSNRYENKSACLTLYSDFFRLSLNDNMNQMGYQQLESYKDAVIKGDAIPIFKKLWRRGLIDIPVY
jgi:hypothetical protein